MFTKKLSVEIIWLSDISTKRALWTHYEYDYTFCVVCEIHLFLCVLSNIKMKYAIPHCIHIKHTQFHINFCSNTPDTQRRTLRNTEMTRRKRIKIEAFYCCVFCYVIYTLHNQPQLLQRCILFIGMMLFAGGLYHHILFECRRRIHQ